MTRAENFVHSDKKYQIKHKNAKRGFARVKEWSKDIEYNKITLSNLKSELKKSRMRDSLDD